jgi:hypothetical protein
VETRPFWENAFENVEAPTDAATWSAWREHLPGNLIEEAAAEQNQIAQTGKAVIRNFFNVALAEKAGGCG